MGETIHKIFDSLVPEPLKHRLRVVRDTSELRSVPALQCHADVLLPVQNIDLAEIWGSPEIESKWNTAAATIRRLGIPDGIGGVNPGDGRAVFYLIRHFRPRSVLEIGTHVGVSTLHIAAALAEKQQDRNSPPGHLVTVDITNVNHRTSGPWVQSGLKRSPSDTVKMMGCGDLVEFVTGTSLDHFARAKKKYDFIFLDGDHAAKTVYREIPAALELLNQDGLILLHDYFPDLRKLWSAGIVIPGPFLATEQLTIHGAQFQAVPLGKLPWTTKLNSNLTSLALLARSAHQA